MQEQSSGWTLTHLKGSVEHTIIIIMAVETVAISPPLLSTDHFWFKNNEEHSIN